MTEKRGKFIVFEGIEGSGKTTQSKMLVERLKKEGRPILHRREPTDDLFFGKLARFVYTHDAEPAVAEELKRVVSHPTYHKAKKDAHSSKQNFLEKFEKIVSEIQEKDYNNLISLIEYTITFDRHDHIRDIIRPTLETGTHIVCDRFFPSTPAYAAANGSDWRPFLQLQHDILSSDFLTPDVIIFLDIPVEAGLARTMEKQKGNKEYFDTKERQRNITKAYKEILSDPAVTQKSTVLHFNGEAEQEKLYEAIWKALKNHAAIS